MIKTCTVYETDCTDPYENLAAEELLMGEAGDEEIILYLWQNEKTIVIGRNQNAWQECSAELFMSEGGRIARRLSGGGAVYHDAGNQNFTFIAKKENYDLKRQLSVIQKAVSSFGITASFSGRNDLLAEGRKFSGNAFYDNGRVRYHHGTLLLNTDMDAMKRYLTPSGMKLAAKGVSSVESRVIALCGIEPRITPQGMRDALKEAFRQTYGAYSIKKTSGLDGLGQLRKKYADPAWNLNRLSAFDIQLDYRLHEALVRLYLSVSKGIITDAQVFSDSMDPSFAQKLQEQLPGRRYTREEVDRIIDSFPE